MSPPSLGTGRLECNCVQFLTPDLPGLTAFSSHNYGAVFCLFVSLGFPELSLPGAFLHDAQCRDLDLAWDLNSVLTGSGIWCSACFRLHLVVGVVVWMKWAQRVLHRSSFIWSSVSVVSLMLGQSISTGIASIGTMSVLNSSFLLPFLSVLLRWHLLAMRITTSSLRLLLSDFNTVITLSFPCFSFLPLDIIFSCCSLQLVALVS